MMDLYICLMKELSIPYRTYFSGTGFHLGIPGSAFRWKPTKDLHLKVKHALNNAGIFQYADPSVTDKTRIIRLINTKNKKKLSIGFHAGYGLVYDSQSNVVRMGPSATIGVSYSLFNF